MSMLTKSALHYASPLPHRRPLSRHRRRNRRLCRRSHRPTRRFHLRCHPPTIETPVNIKPMRIVSLVSAASTRQLGPLWAPVEGSLTHLAGARVVASVRLPLHLPHASQDTAGQEQIHVSLARVACTVSTATSLRARATRTATSRLWVIWLDVLPARRTRSRRCALRAS